MPQGPYTKNQGSLKVDISVWTVHHQKVQSFLSLMLNKGSNTGNVNCLNCQCHFLLSFLFTSFFLPVFFHTAGKWNVLTVTHESIVNIHVGCLLHLSM